MQQRMRWTSFIFDRASWISAASAFILLYVYSLWAFAPGGAWMTALDAAGGKLPETQPGIPAIEPVRSLDALGEATNDYIFWQLLDLPYAFLNLAMMSLTMALGLKALRLVSSPLRFLLFLPLIYFFCELVENALVASFASGLLSPSEPVVLAQQFATTMKFASGMSSFALGLLGVFVALIAALIRVFRKST